MLMDVQHLKREFLVYSILKIGCGRAGKAAVPAYPA
jgi:hypothetical protein